MAHNILNKLYLLRIYRNLHVEFGVYSVYNNGDMGVYTDRQTGRRAKRQADRRADRQTWLNRFLIMNIYTLYKNICAMP